MSKAKLAWAIRFGCLMVTVLSGVGVMVGCPVLLDQQEHYPWWLGFLGVDGSFVGAIALAVTVSWAITYGGKEPGK